MKGRCITVLLFLLPLQFFTVPVIAEDLISASCLRPEPHLGSAAYLFCRTEAWLKALEEAQNTMPADMSIQLWKHDLAGETVSLALVALLFKISTVTPDISLSPEIRIYLERQKNAAIAPTLEEAEKLLILSAIIEEMRVILKKMHEIWPKAENNSDSLSEKIESMAIVLSDLWKSVDILSNMGTSSTFKTNLALKEFSSLSHLPGLPNMARAWEFLDGKKPQAAQMAASSAAQQIEKRVAEESGEGQGWLFLYAWALYLRGQAHVQLNQLALAEKDLEKATRILEQFSPVLTLQIPAHLALAKVAALRHQKPLMCKELEKACLLGSCQQLAQARRQGECGSGVNGQQ